MRHNLFRINSKKFVWKDARLIESKNKSKIIKNISGFNINKLTPEDLRTIADCIERMGFKYINFTFIDDEVYLDLSRHKK